MQKRENSIPSCSKTKGIPAVFVCILFILFWNLSCGREEVKDAPNSPPEITSIRILPENPDVATNLNPVILSQDPDRDPITYHYQWIKNEEEIPGENSSTLTAGKFKKGDLISVKAVPSDGKVSGKPSVSAPVRVVNTPPKVEEVWIEPKVAGVLSNLRVHVKCTDPDGDFVYYTYRWEKNGTVLADEAGEVLKKNRFKKGDSIAVAVTPDDREIQGSPRKSAPILVSNSPPVIISSPPTSTEGQIHIYQVKADDPDGDRIAFELKLRPPGMEINRDTGLIRWEIRKDAKGSHAVEIEASDQEGAKSTQRYTLTVEFR